MSSEVEEFANRENRVAVRTVYDGPVAVRTLEFGGRSVRVVWPEDPDRLLTDSAVLDLNRRDDYMPYWAYLWPAACLLAEAVAREPWIPGTAAVEIGCGLGLAGLFGVASGLRVEFTDYDDAPLRFVAASLRANGFDGTTRLLDWREPSGGPYPVILGADIVYESRLVPLVADVIRALLAPGGVALVAGPYRVATEGLDEALAARGLVATVANVTSELDGRPVRGTLHRIRHQP